MTKIEVEVDDLGVLLFAAGAANAQHIGGPHIDANEQFREVAPVVPDVLDRLARSWRDALRRAESPERFQPATAGQLRFLQTLRNAGGLARLGALESVCRASTRDLLRNGFIDLGVYRETVVWPDGAVNHESQDRRVRLTQRGYDQVLADDERLRMERAKEQADG